MTAPRIARASRSRFFIGLGIFILTMGFVAIFHSSQQQLDEMRHMELRCQQQQEALSVQLEAVEKAAKAERHEQQQFKRNLEREAREQTELKEKTVMDTNQKLSSLQQHYKLLKIEKEDFAEECTKTKAKQLAEIKTLQDKIKSMQIEHEKEINKFKNSKSDKIDQMVAKDAEISRLRKQIDDFNSHCAWRPEDIEHSKPVATSKRSNDKNFNAQIPVSDNLYKIQLGTDNQTNDKQPKNNVNTNDPHGDGSANAHNVENSVKKPGGDVIINSVENFQLVPKPLIGANVRSSTTTTTPTPRRKTSEAANDKLNEAPNAPMPDQSPRASSTTVANKKNNETMGRVRQSKPVPDGVVPIQSSFDEIMIRNLDQKVETPHENNRYANVVDEVAEDGNNKKKSDSDSMKKKLNELQNFNDNDNGAREVNDDNNDFVVHDSNGHKGGGGGGGGAGGAIKNAAEEDMNLYDNKFNLAKPNANNGDAHFQRADDDLTIQRGGGAGGSDDEDAKVLNNDNNKLLNEIDGDQGKVVYPDVLHIEEQLEDEDDDEYANPGARKQDPAVRN